jgi:hypothetical protein
MAAGRVDHLLRSKVDDNQGRCRAMSMRLEQADTALSARQPGLFVIAAHVSSHLATDS